MGLGGLLGLFGHIDAKHILRLVVQVAAHAGHGTVKGAIAGFLRQHFSADGLRVLGEHLTAAGQRLAAGDVDGAAEVVAGEVEQVQV